MKRLIIFLMLSGVLFMTNACHVNDKGMNERDRVLSQYSDDRPYPDVLSEREVVDLMLRDLFISKYNTLKLYLETNPALSNVSLGQVVLVEDYFSPSRGTEPYYYYITGVFPDGTIAAEGIIWAMANSPNAGKIGEASVAGPHSITYRCITKEEAIKYLRKKLNLSPEEKIEIKAVLVPTEKMSTSEWGWAMRVSSTVSTKTLKNEQIKTKVFWLHNTAYDDEDTLSKIRTRDPEWYNDLKTQTKFAALTVDVFDSEKVRKLREWYKNPRWKTMSLEEKDQYIPKLIPIETYVK